MANKFKLHALKATIAAAALFAAQSALAGPTAGEFLKLMDGPGSGPGGEFVATPWSGAFLDGSGSFATFCLEKNEFLSFGQKLKVQQVNTAAVNGGISGGNPDPISGDTAYLYTEYRQGTLSNYDFGDPTLRISDANDLQSAFWFLEQEYTGLKPAAFSALSTQAQAWVNEAYGAAWGENIGNVRVLNLVDTNGVLKQDQLTLIPEPETYAMLLAGLGLMGFVARRRRQFAGA